ncbi:hypothetical protein OROGR_023808 [Orobanche gracilis]
MLNKRLFQKKAIFIGVQSTEKFDDEFDESDEDEADKRKDDVHEYDHEDESDEYDHEDESDEETHELSVWSAMPWLITTLASLYDYSVEAILCDSEEHDELIMPYRKRVKDQIERLITEATTGDTLLIHFAGHSITFVYAMANNSNRYLLGKDV